MILKSVQFATTRCLIWDSDYASLYVSQTPDQSPNGNLQSDLTFTAELEDFCHHRPQR